MAFLKANQHVHKENLLWMPEIYMHIIFTSEMVVHAFIILSNNQNLSAPLFTNKNPLVNEADKLIWDLGM